jgi:hypothetical protein
MLEAAIGQYLQAKVAAGDATAKEIKDWLDGQKGNAQQIKQTRQASANDPAQKRIREQQEALNKEREQLFVGQVAEKVNATATSDIGKAADPYVKQYKLGDEQRKFFIEQLGQKVVAELNADANYKKQIDIRKAAKDRNPQALADFMTSQVRERLPKAALALSRAMYGGGTKPVTSPQQNGQAPQRVSAGRIFVAQRPPNEALDLSYPNAELDMIKGFGKRKSDGQLVQWRK